MVKQQRRFRWAVLGTEFVSHDQHNVNVIRLALAGNIASENYETVKLTSRHCHLMNFPEAARYHLTLDRARAEAGNHLCERRQVMSLGEISRLVELRQRHRRDLPTRICCIMRWTDDFSKPRQHTTNFLLGACHPVTAKSPHQLQRGPQAGVFAVGEVAGAVERLLADLAID